MLYPVPKYTASGHEKISSDSHSECDSTFKDKGGEVIASAHLGCQRQDFTIKVLFAATQNLTNKRRTHELNVSRNSLP